MSLLNTKRAGRVIAPGLALGVAATLLLPASESLAFSKLGQSGLTLSISQRDFRVFNNFADATANNNTTIDPQFPGWDGAEVALWKACIEWNSGAHGNGSGDPTQGNLGDGGANFDAFFAGAATEIGGSNSNTHSAISSCQGGVLAFTEIPTADGWRIRYCESWEWHDGPGDNTSGWDLQGVACHEYGHALGLGHSSVGGSTMWPSVSGGGSSNIRSLGPDDIAGVQCIYGVKFSQKPQINSVSVNGGQVTITGSGFAAVDGEVWFTNKHATSALVDPRVRVTGVTSTGVGTSITVALPPHAGPGNIMVKHRRNGANSLSNTFPFDATGTGVAVTISNVTPSSIPNLIPGTAETITVTGSGFSPTTKVQLDGVTIPGSVTAVSDTTLTFEWEPSTLGTHTLTVVESGLSDSTSINVIANAVPALQVGNGDPGNVVAGSAPLTLGGQPGEIHYVVVSPSNAPSVLPGKINLGLGNAFSTTFEVGLFLTDNDGLATGSASLAGIVNTTLYWQSLRIVLPIAANYPLQESNLQSTFTP